MTTLQVIKDDIKSAKTQYDGDHYASFLLLYANGLGIHATDEDIANGKHIPLIHIVYALEENGDGEQDTEHSEFDFMEGWTGEQKEDYYRAMERKFNIRCVE